MSEGQRVAIVGAGITGLSLARSLVQGGVRVRVFDKGRGLGGRLATRRTAEGLIDHGAQLVSVTTPELRAMTDGLKASGFAACWTGRGVVGLPGMSGLLRPLAQGLDIRQRVEIASIRETGGGLVLTDMNGKDHGPFDSVASTIPAPQARRFTSSDPVADAQLAKVVMAPVWALLLSFPLPLRGHDELGSADGPIRLALRQSAKPGRAPEPDSWIVHATPDWTRAHLEDSAEDVAQALFLEFEYLCGEPLPEPSYIAAHRWRFGLTERPLGAPYVEAFGGRLLLGGDWALGDSAEDGWASACAIAARLSA